MNRLKLNVNTRKILWEKYYNNQPITLCFCGCGRIIPADDYILKNIFNCDITTISFNDNLEYGHIIPNIINNSVNIDNVRPICSTCNKNMGIINLYEYCNLKGYIHKDEHDYDPMDICIESDNEMEIEHNYNHCFHICNSTKKYCKNKIFKNGYCKIHQIKKN